MSLINMEPREKVLHSGATATGNGEILELNSEFGGLSVQISGITSATITFEGTVDGNWVEQRAVNKTTGAVATTATADGIYLFDVVGIRKFRARISAYVSGTIKVTANAVLVVPHIPELNVAGAIPAGTNVVGKVGIDQTANGVQLTDGTNTAAILANGKVPVDLGDTTLAANVAIQDGTDPAKKVTVQDGAILTQLSGSNFTELASDITDVKEQQIEIWETINILTQKQAPPEIFGIKWDKSSEPTLTRTDDAVGLTANAGVGYGSVTNDFDKLPIFGEIEQVEDSLGNVFMKVPKFYCRDTDGTSHKQMQVSKRRYSGFYLPYLFWDFTNKKELPYVLIGKHKASLGTGNKLESKPNRYPLINKNIVEFRTYANNNNADGLTGYQQNDLHWIDLLRKLAFIEFATLDIQTIMKGYTEGQYTATHLATVTETGVNRIIVANAHADLYRVGQAISVGTSQGGTQIFYGRTITSIDVYDANNKAITFDGEPVTITTGNMLYNTGYKTGFSSQLLASSGSIVANDGKYPCVYRGIESPFGDVWEFIDGLNINDRQAWICKNAAQYASNLFASPYEQLGYVNYNAHGYTKEMGFDPNFPFAQLPTAITGGTTPTQYYGDYYYQDAGQRVARFGGRWDYVALAGLSCWALGSSSSDASVAFGGRLMKKAL